MDLFVLLILHSTANRKKAMESLIRNKIKNGHFTEEMLSAAFNSHSQVGMRDILKQGFIQKLQHKKFVTKAMALPTFYTYKLQFSIH